MAHHAEVGLAAPRRWFSAATVMLGITLAVLDNTIFNLAIPAMAQDLGVSGASAIWILNSFQLTVLIALLPLASLGERVGYKTIYLAGTATFAVASAIAAWSDSFGLLITARVFQGLGAACIMAINMALVRLTYPTPMLGQGLALNAMVVGLASVSGPVLAAVALSAASWRLIFLVNLPICALLLIVGSYALPSTPKLSEKTHISVWDVLLNSSLFVLLFLGADMFRAALSGSGSLVTGFALLIACTIVGTVHVRRQSRQTRPLLPTDLLRIPVFRLSLLAGCAAFAAQTIAFLALPFLLLESWRQTPAQAGAVMSIWPASAIMAALVAGRLINRYQDGWLGGAGLVLLATGLGTLSLAAGGGPNTLDACAVALVLCGFGFGLFHSPNNHAVITNTPVDRAGAAGAVLGMARLTGQTAGATLLALVFSGAGGTEPKAVAISLSVAASLAVFAAICSVLRTHTTSYPE